MKIHCPTCGDAFPELPEGTTEHQARLALQAVLLWYAESPIREIQMANAMCGMRFPINEIAEILPVPASKHAPGNTGLADPEDF
jgi:hypothetical protein